MRTAVFLQVRLSSRRLPRKALLRLCDKTVIEHAMSALKEVPADVYALLTDDDSSHQLEPYARLYNFEVFRGSPSDVLKRFADAARLWRIDRYYRATGDNPLVSGELAVELHAKHEAVGADFSGYLGPPLGTGVELVDASALLQADAEATDVYEREHVSPFIYRRPDRFTIHRPWVEDPYLYPEGLVTLDTWKDYDFLKELFDELYTGEPIDTQRLVAWLRDRADSRADDARHHIYSFDTAG